MAGQTPRLGALLGGLGEGVQRAQLELDELGVAQLMEAHRRQVPIGVRDGAPVLVTPAEIGLPSTMQRLAQTRFTLQIDARLSRSDGGPALRARPVDARFAGAYGVDLKRASTVSFDVVAVPGPGVAGEGEE